MHTIKAKKSLDLATVEHGSAKWYINYKDHNHHLIPGFINFSFAHMRKQKIFKTI